MNALFLPLVIGAWQIIVVVLVVLLMFGGKKIPELMRGLGGGIKEFKDASREDVDEKDASRENIEKKNIDEVKMEREKERERERETKF